VRSLAQEDEADGDNAVTAPGSSGHRSTHWCDEEAHVAGSRLESLKIIRSWHRGFLICIKPGWLAARESSTA
jgi:hypothetical protein